MMRKGESVLLTMASFMMALYDGFFAFAAVEREMRSWWLSVVRSENVNLCSKFKMPLHALTKLDSINRQH